MKRRTRGSAAARAATRQPHHIYLNKSNGNWYWKPPRKARGNGDFPATPLGSDTALAWAAARRINERLEAWIASGARIDRRRRRNVPWTVAEVLAEWSQKAWRNKRPKTIEGYRNMIRHLERHFGNHTAATLSEIDVDDWIGSAGATAPETVRHAVSVARTAFKWAGRAKMIPAGHNPFRETGVGTGNKRGKWISASALPHVMAACEKAGRPSLGLAFCLGFLFVQRISDMLALRHGWLQQHGNGVRLRFNQSKGRKLDPSGNMRRDGFFVDIAAPPAAIALLDRFAAPGAGSDPAILCEWTGRPWEARAAANAFRKILQAYIDAHPQAKELAGLQLRDCRRSGFLHAVQGASGNVPAVCSMSGHSIQQGYDIVEHYLPKTPEQADLAAQAFGDIAI